MPVQSSPGPVRCHRCTGVAVKSMEACNAPESVQNEDKCEVFRFTPSSKQPDARSRRFVDSLVASIKIGDRIRKGLLTDEVTTVDPHLAFWEGLCRLYKVTGLHVRVYGQSVLGYVITKGKRYRMEFDWAKGFKLKSVEDSNGVELKHIVDNCRSLCSPHDAEAAIVEIGRLN